MFAVFATQMIGHPTNDDGSYVSEGASDQKLIIHGDNASTWFHGHSSSGRLGAAYYGGWRVNETFHPGVP